MTQYAHIFSLSLFSRPPSMHKHNTMHDCCVRREIKTLLSLTFGDLYRRQCLPLFSLSLYLLYTVASLSLSVNSASQHSFPKGIPFLSLSLSIFQKNYLSYLTKSFFFFGKLNLTKSYICTTRWVLLYMLWFLFSCSVQFSCFVSASLFCSAWLLFFCFSCGHTLNPETMQ